ncbi:MAG TPA: GAF domain-containing sensor histidine kinase [Bacillales bacterium]|nr:GAF domain-containing sensor histidine kinase [Bacillales bacterium]
MAKSFENNDLFTLKVIAETLNRSNDLHDMLQSVLEKLLDVTGLTTGWLFLVAEKPEYTFVASHNLPPALSRENKKPMCSGVCFCLNEYWRDRLDKPVNIIECKRLEDAKKYNWGDRNGLSHHATVPLAAGGERFGILNVAAPGKEHFSEQELTLLQSVAYQIGTAVKRIRLAQKQQELNLIEERNRLSRDLHDSVNQKLFSLSLTAHGAKAVLDDKKILGESLDHIQKLSQDALKEMRSLIWQLRPAGVEEGVVTALKKYGKYLGLKVSDQVEGVRELPRAVEEALWRIGQEALNNVKKHSGIDVAEVKMKATSKKVVLKITDEGNGCDLEKAREKGSFGLTNMRERAAMFGGSIRIHSEKGGGTEVKVTFPLEEIEGGGRRGD